MKKIVFSLMVMACSVALFAQDSIDHTATSTGSYPAYNAPNNVRMNFQSTHPSATNVTWQPMNEWWVASYTTNNRPMRVYYGPNGTNFALSLPAIQNNVPEDVITKVLNQYGNKVYDITMMKSASNATVYAIRLVDNGSITSTWMNEDGSTTSDVFIHR